MRISDWSSDVCSSDLVGHDPVQAAELAPERAERVATGAKRLAVHHEASASAATRSAGPFPLGRNDRRHPVGPGRVQTVDFTPVHRPALTEPDPAQRRRAAASVEAILSRYGPPGLQARARPIRSAFITLPQAAPK